MSETLIPTMSLRFVERDVPERTRIADMRFGGPIVFRTARILQQRFTTPAGAEVWQDVPVVKP